MQLIMVFALSVILFGCVPYETQAQQRYKSNQTNLRTSYKNYELCMVKMRQSEEARRLEERYVIDFNKDKNNFEKIILNDYCSDQDIADFIKYRNTTQGCRDQALIELSYVDARYSNEASNTYMEIDKNLLRVLNKEVTIGEYNKTLISIINKSNFSLAEKEKLMHDEFVNRHYAENQAAIQTIQNLQNNRYKQQIINNQVIQQRKTTTTNCYFIGNSLNCTQY